MKTTLILNDELARRLKARATADGVSMSSIVEQALATMLDAPERAGVPALPTFAAGQPTVDIADRDALAARMDAP